MSGIAGCAGFQRALRARSCVRRTARSGARRAARPIILLSTSDHFMIMFGALLIIFTASRL